MTGAPTPARTSTSATLMPAAPDGLVEERAAEAAALHPTPPAPERTTRGLDAATLIQTPPATGDAFAPEPAPAADPVRIAVAGAGAVGLYLAAGQALRGRTLRCLTRRATADAIDEAGLRITDYDGLDASIGADRLGLTESPAEAFADADIVLVAVKSKDTASMAALIGAHAPRDAQVVSLQNGVRNADRLREALPGRDVRAAVVAYNVTWRAPAWLHRGVSGGVTVEDADGALAAILDGPGSAAEASADIAAVQWAKLLINLNNGLNALSGETLRDELADREWRKLLSASIEEALDVLDHAGIRVGRVGAADPRRLAKVLRLPTLLFRLLTHNKLRLDKTARSSMQDDLRAGRPTEIADLQGEIVALAQAHKMAAPTNAAVMAMIREAETAGPDAPCPSPARLRARVAAPMGRSRR